MKQYLARVLANAILWSDVHRVTFDAPDLARVILPAQCALVRDPATFDPYLRRVAWLYGIDESRVAFTMSAHDAAMARVGTLIDLRAPCGNAIEFAENQRHIALIGEDSRIAPLVALAHHAIAQQRAVVLAHRARDIFPAHLLAPEIEFRADLESLNEMIAWADAIIAYGSDEFYQSLADAIRATRYRIDAGFARVWIDLAMPCGDGACYVCAVDTARGLKRACVDGPMFDLTWFSQWMAR